ncbi:SH3 domain-containing protein [Capnocytophaga sp. Marseille-Q4570]|uniref:SH3 domain-containing protein n=2 Tax=Capnocytophaga TaxID=1016 RepID=A0ABS3PUA9_9FLAO|nr:SH3 domain-containing protein [Capnocytophaga bilenii]MBO1882896.1 SH3 domain-containing protein [Capnocytophaga bilenii]
MDWKIIILFLIVTFNSYSQKIEDYTIFKDGEVYINFRRYIQRMMPQIVAELEKYNYKKPSEEHYKQVIHSFINKDLLPQNIVVLNDDLNPYIAIQDKGIIYTEDGYEAKMVGLLLFHLNQYLFYKDLKSLEWLKDNYEDILSDFVVTFGVYRDKTLLKWYLDRKINDETAIQSLFYYEKNMRQFIRKEMVLAVDKMLRGTPNEHDFAINAAKYYVQRYSHDFDNPKEIIDFLFNSSRGYYIEDPDGYSNIRADKSTSSKILSRIKSGEKIDVLDDTSNWYLIKTKEGLKGYVHKSRIKIK